MTLMWLRWSCSANCRCCVEYKTVLIVEAWFVLISRARNNPIPEYLAKQPTTTFTLRKKIYWLINWVLWQFSLFQQKKKLHCIKAFTMAWKVYSFKRQCFECGHLRAVVGGWGGVSGPAGLDLQWRWGCAVLHLHRESSPTALRGHLSSSIAVEAEPWLVDLQMRHWGFLSVCVLGCLLVARAWRARAFFVSVSSFGSLSECVMWCLFLLKKKKNPSYFWRTC